MSSSTDSLLTSLPIGSQIAVVHQQFEPPSHNFSTHYPNPLTENFFLTSRSSSRPLLSGLVGDMAHRTMADILSELEIDFGMHSNGTFESALSFIERAVNWTSIAPLMPERVNRVNEMPARLPSLIYFPVLWYAAFSQSRPAELEVLWSSS